MKQWDYSRDGLYFITICVKHRARVLGTVRNGKIILNEWGNPAHECWQGIPIHFPGVEIDQFVVMPNHVHGIVVIRNHIGERS
jgi:REP element-mobilizing transposase RayT